MKYRQGAAGAEGRGRDSDVRGLRARAQRVADLHAGIGLGFRVWGLGFRI